MKRNLTKAAGGILLGVVLLAALTACGGPAGATTPSTATPQNTATNQPAPTATAMPAATVAPAPTASPTGSSSNDLLAQGKLLFEKTAGGVGCAYCHGLDGKGRATSGASTPYIRGMPEAGVRAALAGGVPVMSFIKLSESELTAVVAYLQYLGQQP